MAWGIKKERERLIALFRQNHEAFVNEKVQIASEKNQIESDMYYYDADDPALYDFLEELADAVFQLSEKLSLYHLIENEMQHDTMQLLNMCDEKKAAKKAYKFAHKETPSQTWERWKLRSMRGNMVNSA